MRSAVNGAVERLFAIGAGQTQFQFIMHNRAGDARGSGWWHFNPPYIHDDVLALRYWLRLFRAGVQGADPGARPEENPAATRFAVRAGCAHPIIQRDTLDGLPDITLLSNSLAERLPALAANEARYGRVWSTADELSPELGWAVVYKWVWAAALSGARGVHVPSALGNAASWERADDAALLYPPDAQSDGAAPSPSLRLKALCRAQQDMEWLELWIAQEVRRGTPRGYALAVAAQVLIERAQARVPQWTTLLPVVRFGGTLDTVAFEELRRTLRLAVKP
jgi:hypothetical protein